MNKIIAWVKGFFIEERDTVEITKIQPKAVEPKPEKKKKKKSKKKTAKKES